MHQCCCDFAQLLRSTAVQLHLAGRCAPGTPRGRRLKATATLSPVQFVFPEWELVEGDKAVPATDKGALAGLQRADMDTVSEADRDVMHCVR